MAGRPAPRAPAAPSTRRPDGRETGAAFGAILSATKDGNRPMRISPPGRLFALALPAALAALAVLATTGVQAQFPGFGYSLPKDDFVWNWGRNPEGANTTAFTDFEVRGGEGGFQCELTGKVGFSGRLSRDDIRALEDELRRRMDFIYAAATYMSEFDRQNLIEWARLDCDKFEAEPSTAEEKAEREARAKEKMQKEIERRRARERD
jgi:hypothetical protein